MRPAKGSRNTSETLPLLDRIIAAVSPMAALKRAQARHALALSAYYRSASTTRLRSDWLASGNADATPPSWEMTALRARSRDANRNDPIASSASETLNLNIIGSGLTPQSRIRSERIGLDPKACRRLQRDIESLWAAWSKTADAANMLNFDEIQFLALAKIIEDGEIIAIPTWADDSWRTLSRAIELVEADRLEAPASTSGAQPNGAKTTNTVNGITFGDRGQPLRYWIRKAIKGAPAYAMGMQPQDYVAIDARDTMGRPKILHVFPMRRVGQTRGIPWFAPVLSYFKDMADYLEAEVVAARVAACLAVFITKSDPMSTAFALGPETESATGSRIQSIEPGLVGYLQPGESVNVVDPKRPGDAFPAFVDTMLRTIGGALGIPYELLAKDFSKTNYSSARASLLEGRKMFTRWREWFAAKFCQPIFELVMEEAWLRGVVDMPDFYANRDELCRCAWLGGGWGWVDPVKEIQASSMAVGANLSTLAEEAASQGRDWEDILEQRAVEMAEIESYGLAGSPTGQSTPKP